MLFKFPNSTVAAAFISAVIERVASMEDVDYDYTPPDEVEGLVEVMAHGPENITVYTAGTRRKPDVTVNTLAQLETAIGEALALVSNAGSSPSRMVIRHHDDGNQSDYHCILHKDGSVEMGCQIHKSKDVPRIIAAAREWNGGKRFPSFTVGAHLYTVEVGERPGLMRIDGNRIDTSVILALEKVREQFMAGKIKAKKPAAPKPVRLFAKQ